MTLKRVYDPLTGWVFTHIMPTMVVNNITEKLVYIGFSEYEARAYVALLGRYPVTPYELARASGIPTSKIYGVMSRLSEKGMVSLVDDSKRKKRYIPVEPGEFLESFGNKVLGTLRLLKDEMSVIGRDGGASHIWNISDYSYMMDKAERMVLQAEKTLLVSIYREEMEKLEEHLQAAEERGVSVALMHFGPAHGRAGQLFHHPIEPTIYAEKGGRGVVIVADSREAIMGMVLGDGAAEGAWSANRGFVALAEDYIRHDIYFMKVVKRFNRQLRKLFGYHYEKLRDVFTDEANI
jgi:sugar-specific transcriptional regulator TrmB